MTSPDPAPPADPSRYRQKTFGAGFWIAMAFSLVCIVGAVFVGFFLHRLFPANQPAPPAEAEAVPAEISQSYTPPQVVDPLPALETPAQPPPSDMEGLGMRIQDLERRQDQTAQAATAALAAAALLQVAQTSQPFTRELAAVELALPNAADYGALRGLSQTGAPTRAALSADFAAAAARGAVAARRPTSESSLLDRVGHAISGVITIRRVDYTEGTNVDAVLARAEALLHRGNLDGALAELEALPEASQQAMSGWLDGARRRVEIDRRVAMVREAALQNLRTVTGA